MGSQSAAVHRHNHLDSELLESSYGFVNVLLRGGRETKMKTTEDGTNRFVAGDFLGAKDGVHHTSVGAARKDNEAFVPDIYDQSLLIPYFVQPKGAVRAHLIQARPPTKR